MPPKPKETFDAEVKRLAKLPDNKVCADCPAKMPSYVNLTYKSFICTTCSGIHRELQSKIKGVSMSTFNADDVSDMAAGGNALCNQHYLARFSNEIPLPTGTDIVKLREFMRMKYVEKRWAPSTVVAQNGTASQQSGSSKSFSISINSTAAAPMNSGFSAKALFPPPPASLDLLDMVAPSPSSAAGTKFDQFGSSGSFAAPSSAFDAFNTPVSPPSNGTFDAFGSPDDDSDTFSSFSSSAPLPPPPISLLDSPKNGSNGLPEPVLAAPVPRKDFSAFDELQSAPTPVGLQNPFMQQDRSAHSQQEFPPRGQPGSPPQPGYAPQQGFPPQSAPHAPYLGPQGQSAFAPQPQSYLPQQPNQLAAQAPNPFAAQTPEPALFDAFSDMSVSTWSGAQHTQPPAPQYSPPLQPSPPPAQRLGIPQQSVAQESENPFDMF